jgi:hypothetical protein
LRRSERCAERRPCRSWPATPPAGCRSGSPRRRARPRASVGLAAPAPAPARGGNPEDLDPGRVGALGQVALDPGPEQALLESARRIEEEEDPLPAQGRPAGLVDPRGVDRGTHGSQIVSQRAGSRGAICRGREDEALSRNRLDALRLAARETPPRGEGGFLSASRPPPPRSGSPPPGW